MTISLLVPFRDDDGTRTRPWAWLERYYKHVLPQAELIVGTDDGVPFSKAVAVNNAAMNASGDIFVVLDSDALIDGDVLKSCAEEMRETTLPLWFIPFGTLFRMTQEWTELALATDPEDGYPPPIWLMDRDDSYEDMLHRAPGLVHVVSREMWFDVGGYDPRFRGWGGEDTAFVNTLSALHAEPKRTQAPLIHLWHDRPGSGSARTRTWVGQEGRANMELRAEYTAAIGNKQAMRALVNQHKA